MIDDNSAYPNHILLHMALRQLESAIAMPGNIEYLRDLPSERGSALTFTMTVSAYIDAIEGKRKDDL